MSDLLKPASPSKDQVNTSVAAPAAKRKLKDPEKKTSGIHTEPTLVKPHSLTPTTSKSGTILTPIDALHLEEIERTRVFGKANLVLAAGVALILPFVDGDPIATKLFAASLFCVSIALGWLVLRIRNPADYTLGKLFVGGVPIWFAVFAGTYYWGLVSPACGAIVIGIYFLSFSGSRAITLTTLLATTLGQVLLATLVLSGTIADRGMIPTDILDMKSNIISQGVIITFYINAYLMARSSRRKNIDAMEELQIAVRSASQREALLREVRQELDRALRIGGPGRYTEQEIGQFRLGVIIGRGGMGEVYEATHIETNSPAAVKLLHPQVLADPAHVKRFMREIETVSQLKVANVVTVFEYGTTEGGVPYMIMEKLSGNDLAHYLRKQRRFSIEIVVTLLRQIGTGLAAAQDAGIVHRDIKPQNLFLANQKGHQPVWKILDFGVSTLVDHGGTLTQGKVVGTPGYMSPEQAQGKKVDHRSDLYSLASITYRALTGRPAFAAEDVPRTLYEVVYKMPTKPSTLVECHPDVDSVLAIGLCKNRDLRFEHGHQFADALAQASRGQLPNELRWRAKRILSKLGWGEVR